MVSVKTPRIQPLAAFLLITCLAPIAAVGATRRAEPSHELRSARVRGGPLCSLGLGQLEHYVASQRIDAGRQAKLELMLRDAREDAGEIRGRLERARANLARLLHAELPAEATVAGKLDEIGRMESELIKAQVLTLLRVRAALTPEERKGFREKAAARPRGCKHP